MHRYRVDGGTDENLAWIEAGDRREAEKALSELSLPTGELFTFDLMRDVGVSSASPGRELCGILGDEAIRRRGLPALG